MLRHQENLYKTFNITYHDKYIPYPRLSYRPYDGPLCPVKGLYHEMHSIVIACRGDLSASSTASRSYPFPKPTVIDPPDDVGACATEPGGMSEEIGLSILRFVIRRLA